MAIGCGAKCAKLILIVFNFIFWLSGAAILGVGIWIRVDPDISKYQKVIQLSVDDPYIATAAYILIAIGGFVFIVGFFGCCGAIKESKCMLGLYLFFLLIVMAGELAAGILVAVFKGDIEAKMKEGMSVQVKTQYGNNESFDLAWDFTQYDRKCCGVDGPEDFKGSVFATKSGQDVPISCCVMAATSTAEDMQPDDLATCRAEGEKIQKAQMVKTDAKKINVAGCSQKITEWFNKYAAILIGVGCGIAGLEIFGFIFAVCLCRNIGDVDN